MTAQQLKNSILQMAVQGKLVPQDPNDEPASVLLQRIRAEKEQLIKDGRIKKEKNPSFIFRGDDGLFYEKVGNKDSVCIEDEIPFEIPDSWGWIRLGELCDIVNGFTPLRTKPEFWDNGTVNWFTIDDIHTQGRRIRTTKQFINKSALSKDTNRILPKGTVLLCCTASVGEYAITEIPLTTNQQFNGLIIKDIYRDYYYNEFLFEIAQTFKDRLITLAGKTTFNFVSVKKLSCLLIPMPSVNEQFRIVEKIESIYPYIEQYKDVEIQLSALDKDLPTNLKNSILQIAVQGKLVPQDLNDEPASVLIERIHDEKEQLIKDGKIKRDKHESVIYRRDGSYYENVDGKEECIDDEIPFEIPGNWEWIQLGDIGNWRSGATPSRQHPEYYSGSIPWLKTGDLNDGYIDYIPESISESAVRETSVKINPVGSVLIAMYGATIGKLGILDIEATTNQACCACMPFKGVFNEYLFYFLMSQKDNFVKQGAGGAQPNISKEKIVATLMPLPPIEEQYRIVDTLKEILSILDKLK